MGFKRVCLIFKYGIPANTLHKMKHGEAIKIKTLDELCFILDCEVEDILLHIKDKDENPALLIQDRVYLYLYQVIVFIRFFYFCLIIFCNYSAITYAT